MMEQRQIKEFNGHGKFGRSLVHCAVLDGDMAMIQDILDHELCASDLVNSVNWFHDTPLLLAAIMGFADMVELLLDRQAELEHQNLIGRTPLMLASEHGHAECVRVLLVNSAIMGAAEDTTKNLAWTFGGKRPDESYLAELNRRGPTIGMIKEAERERAGGDIFGSTG